MVPMVWIADTIAVKRCPKSVGRRNVVMAGKANLNHAIRRSLVGVVRR